MGFFSKVCSKTYLPVTNPHKGYPDLYQVVALLPNGTKIEGEYDGYGRVGGVDLNNTRWNRVKFVLKFAYDGEEYKDLPRSHNELAQGFFMDDQFLDYCMEKKKFDSYKEYEKAFEQYANW